MKYTNETLKQQPSEDFTNIDEDEPYPCTKNFSSQYEKYERETGELNDRLHTEMPPKLWSDNSSGTKVVKISCLSLSKNTFTSNQSSRYVTGDMSPGMKFQQRRHSKINSMLLNQFLKDKQRLSNSCDKVERTSNPFIINTDVRNKENNDDNAQDSQQMTPTVSLKQNAFPEHSSRKILVPKT